MIDFVELLNHAISSMTLSALVPASESSSTPLSSSIPSPDISLIEGSKAANINNVSTSTSGLSDYINCAKFRFINDSIKSFEKQFNNEQPRLSEPPSQNGVSNSEGGLINHNEISRELMSKPSKSNGHCKPNQAPSLKPINGNGPTKRIASNSIPILKKNVI